MGFSIDVDESSFGAEVLERSQEQLVVVDFFATWCGPCKLLKPMLEGLVPEYDLTLAKVDIDACPNLAHEYGVEGVPDVRFVWQGKVTSEFVGVPSEEALRDRLGQFGLRSGLDEGLLAISAARSMGDTAQVQTLIQQLVNQYPSSVQVIVLAVELFLEHGQLEVAQKLVSRVEANVPREWTARVDGLKTLIQLGKFVQSPPTDPATAHALDGDYLKVAQSTLQGNYEAALSGLLEILSCDRKYQNDGARKTMIGLFNVLGEDHPLTKEYRKRMMQAMY
jgi:putative thioredoxin